LFLFIHILFLFLSSVFETRSCYIAQVVLKLLSSNDPE
jgi:hypothetical protein